MEGSSWSKSTGLTTSFQMEQSGILTALKRPSAVAERGLEAFLDRELEMLEAIERSRADFREGRTVSHEEVMARIQATIDRHRTSK